MTIREQALGLDASPSQVHAWRRRGMPAELGPSQAWIAANIRRRGRNQHPSLATVAPPPAAGTDDPDDLRDAKWLARRAFEEASKATPAMLPQLIGAYHRACAAITEIERAMIARELDAETLMHRDQVSLVIAEFCHKLTGLLDALPAGVAAQANPADPELARDAMADAVEQIRVCMSSDMPLK